MYVNDPFTVIRPHRVQPAPKVDERLLEFGDEVRGAGRGHTVGKPQKGLMQRGVCVYHNGRHACYYQSDYCPAADSGPYVQERPQDINWRPMTLRPQ